MFNCSSGSIEFYLIYSQYVVNSAVQVSRIGSRDNTMNRISEIFLNAKGIHEKNN